MKVGSVAGKYLLIFPVYITKKYPVQISPGIYNNYQKIFILLLFLFAPAASSGKAIHPV